MLINLFFKKWETSNGKEDIIIKNYAKDIYHHFTDKSFTLIWHDPNIDSPENQKHLQNLQRSFDVQTFANIDDSLAYFNTIDSAGKTCLIITSGRDGDRLIKEINSKTENYQAYIFCYDVNKHKQWAQAYGSKVSVFSSLTNILQEIKKIAQETSSYRLDFPSFVTFSDGHDKSKLNRIGLYLGGFVNFDNRKQAMQDFIALAQTLKNVKNVEEMFKLKETAGNLKKPIGLRKYSVGTRNSALYIDSSMPVCGLQHLTQFSTVG